MMLQEIHNGIFFIALGIIVKDRHILFNNQALHILTNILLQCQVQK